MEFAVLLVSVSATLVPTEIVKFSSSNEVTSELAVTGHVIVAAPMPTILKPATLIANVPEFDSVVYDPGASTSTPGLVALGARSLMASARSLPGPISFVRVFKSLNGDEFAPAGRRKFAEPGISVRYC